MYNASSPAAKRNPKIASITLLFIKVKHGFTKSDAKVQTNPLISKNQATIFSTIEKQKRQEPTNQEYRNKTQVIISGENEFFRGD